MGLYAKFFNAVTDECSDENWVLGGVTFTPGSPVTTDLRTRLNTLTDNCNDALRKAITRAQGNLKVATLVEADWDPFVVAIDGRFCEAGASSDPADVSNVNVQFIKFSTSGDEAGDLKIRQDQFGPAYGLAITDNHTYILTRDAPADASYCDGILKTIAGYFPGLPDSIGSVFHPSQSGHETIASFALDAVRQGRAKILGKYMSPPSKIFGAITPQGLVPTFSSSHCT